MPKGKKSQKQVDPAGDAKREDVRIGEPVKREVRVKINVAECAEKESRVVKLENAVKKIQLTMAPQKKEITKLNKEIDKLCADVADSTEERTILVRDEFHYSTNVVRTVRADDGEQVGEDRTMTAAEAQLDHTQTPAKGGIVGGKAGAALRLANPVLTPGEAGAARKAANPAFQDAVDASDSQHLTPGEAIARARAEADATVDEAARAHREGYGADGEPEANA